MTKNVQFLTIFMDLFCKHFKLYKLKISSIKNTKRSFSKTKYFFVRFFKKKKIIHEKLRKMKNKTTDTHVHRYRKSTKK